LIKKKKKRIDSTTNKKKGRENKRKNLGSAVRDYRVVEG